MHPLEQLRNDALREIESARDEQALETARSKYLGEWASRSLTDRTLKTNGIASTHSTRRPSIRHGTNRTLFIYRTADCCALTRPPYKFARCKPGRRRSGSSRPAPLIAAMRWTRLTARSFTKSKASTSIKTSASQI